MVLDTGSLVQRSIPGNEISTPASVESAKSPDERPQPNAETASGAGQDGRSGTFSFLFVDDSVHRRNQIRRLLLNEPIRFVWASNAKEAIAALRKRRYDIISLDHDLSGAATFVPDYPGDLPTLHEQFGAIKSTRTHEPDGLDVTQALISTPNVEAYIFIHSMNPVGAGHMKQLLPQATWLPYQHVWLEVNMIKAFVRRGP